MSNSLDIKWPMSLGAPAGSLEAKLPRPEDIGTDIPDPQRYFCKDFMQKEWNGCGRKSGCWQVSRQTSKNRVILLPIATGMKSFYSSATKTIKSEPLQCLPTSWQTCLPDRAGNA